MPLVKYLLLLIAIFTTNCTSLDTPLDHLKDKALISIPAPPGATKAIADAYAKECIRKESWYCFPLKDPQRELPGFDVSIWKAEYIIDVCKDEILEIGECVAAFECNPVQFIVGEAPCTNSEGYSGTRTLYCDKGHLKSGPCQSECEEEICDYKDNDCDGVIDEFQRNPCGECGPVDQEICDNIDNDCDGFTDEGLTDICKTACGIGTQFCFYGVWQGCTATTPTEEVCDQIDNNCNGKTDEGLQCGCSFEQMGALFPCLGDPLECGKGWKECECVDNTCSKLEFSDCYPDCYFFPIPEQECDLTTGTATEEKCNNYDDNCNDLIDEALTKTCYTGPSGTANKGICIPGDQICLAGEWGNFDIVGNFIAGYCHGQVTPYAKDSCNGVDEDCDGIVDSGMSMKETDILFIIDGSGSMLDEIAAVISAISNFSAMYEDETVLRWGVIFAPLGYLSQSKLTLSSDLTSFSEFFTTLSAVSKNNLNAAYEYVYDGIYLALLPLSSTSPYTANELSWIPSSGSDPIKGNFIVGWRPEVNHVIITFSDEEGQSRLFPKITQNVLFQAAQSVSKLRIYTFSPVDLKFFNIDSADWGWEALTLFGLGGDWFELTNDSDEMFNSLTEILDAAVCAE